MDCKSGFCGSGVCFFVGCFERWFHFIAQADFKLEILFIFLRAGIVSIYHHTWFKYMQPGSLLCLCSPSYKGDSGRKIVEAQALEANTWLKNNTKYSRIGALLWIKTLYHIIMHSNCYLSYSLDKLKSAPHITNTNLPKT